MDFSSSDNKSMTSASDGCALAPAAAIFFDALDAFFLVVAFVFVLALDFLAGLLLPFLVAVAFLLFFAFGLADNHSPFSATAFRALFCLDALVSFEAAFLGSCLGVTILKLGFRC